MLACEDVPRRWRRLYALAAYLYLRPGELAALDWRCVFLAEGYVDVRVTMDLRTGLVKPCPKTKHRRRVPIHRNVAPLLQALHNETGGTGLVVQNVHENKLAEHGFPPLEDLASTLRKHLRRARVTRSDLFDDTATTKRLGFYDLRATGITWEVLAGTEHTRVMQRAGHERFDTMLGCIREAEVLGQRIGAPFPPLPSTLLHVAGKPPASAPSETGLAPGFVPRIVPDETERRNPQKMRAKRASPTGFECSPGCTNQHQNGSIRDCPPGRITTDRDAISRTCAPPVTACDSKSTNPLGGAVAPGGGMESPPVDPVETSLARALELASAACEWSVVATLARELEARRRARVAPGVADLEDARAKRDGMR